MMTAPESRSNAMQLHQLGLDAAVRRVADAANGGLGSKPTYARNFDTVPQRVLHFGIGGFHRSHMALYTQESLNRAQTTASPTAPTPWGIVGVGLRQEDVPLLSALESQDGLYSLLERQGSDETIHVVGSVMKVLFGATVVHDVLPIAACRRTKIISLTVTEKGYCLTPSKTLDLQHPLVASDIRGMRGSCTAVEGDVRAAPSSVVGVLSLCLKGRMATTHQEGVTVMSCDNVPHNGAVLKAAVLDFVDAAWPSSALLQQWIVDKCRFPNSMVDRITPVTTQGDVAHVARTYGLADRCPVVAERFRQWVVEDEFVHGVRPAWDGLPGVQFVSDVAPYEMMKLRLLNGSHLAIACLGDIAGFTYIDEVLRDPILRRYMKELMQRETATTLMPVPGIDVDVYQRTLLDRFSNEAIKDTVQRVTTDAPLHVVVDVLQDRLKQGPASASPLLVLALTAWLLRARGGFGETNRPIVVNHPLAAQLQGSTPTTMLSRCELFGTLGHHADIVTTVSTMWENLLKNGVRRTIETYLPQSKL